MGSAPDLVVVGLQEIVELSAANVMVDSVVDVGSKDAVKLWVSNVTAALAELSVKLSEQQKDQWLGAFSFQVRQLDSARIACVDS